MFVFVTRSTGLEKQHMGAILSNGIVSETRARARSSPIHFTRNRTQTGLGTSAWCPVGEGIPVLGSILKTTMLFESWFAAMRNAPLGSIPKLRGIFPPVGQWPFAVSFPVAWSTSKIAIELWPRLET